MCLYFTKLAPIFKIADVAHARRAGGCERNARRGNLDGIKIICYGALNLEIVSRHVLSQSKGGISNG